MTPAQTALAGLVKRMEGLAMGLRNILFVTITGASASWVESRQRRSGH